MTSFKSEVLDQLYNKLKQETECRIHEKNNLLTEIANSNKKLHRLLAVIHANSSVLEDIRNLIEVNTITEEI